MTTEIVQKITSMASDYSSLDGKQKLELFKTIKEDLEMELVKLTQAAEELKVALQDHPPITTSTSSKSIKCGRKPKGWWPSKVKDAIVEHGKTPNDWRPVELYELMKTDSNIRGMERKNAIKQIAATLDLLKRGA